MSPLVLTLSNTKCIKLTKMFESCITIVCRDVPVYALLLLSSYAYLLVLHCAFVDTVFWHVVYSFYSCVHSRKIWSVEDLETLPAGSKPRTSHHRSPGGERRWKKEALDDLPWKDERGCSSIRRTLEPFKGNFGKTSERRAEAHMDFSERIYTILNLSLIHIWRCRRRR